MSEERRFERVSVERKVGVAVDFSPCSKKALLWAVENVVRSGDHVVLVNVQPPANYEEGEMQLWETTGSPFIPLREFADPAVIKKYGVRPDKDTLDALTHAAKEKEIVIVMKIFWGDPREKICEAIEKIPLNFIMVGSRGHSTIKRILLGSVSDYIVHSAACPVTVVKINEHEV
ncbi:hypothetical protein MRB53_031906 [Persea americana]|uniref:Uncharacterized protein n=1 Tax=Persea americana TaxID=3435 RepID=A0ACC2KQR5_PERAE|nr:hypothetical protein MRB53_031906 [Persea americana]